MGPVAQSFSAETIDYHEKILLSGISLAPARLCTTVCPEKSVTLTISVNIPKLRNKFWNFFNCTDTPNPWPKHM